MKTQEKKNEMNTKKILSIAVAVLMALCMVPAGLAAEKVTAGQIIAFKAKAKLGDAVSQYNLGLCYLNGWGVAKDMTEAAKLFRKAADKGIDEAQFNLGACYANGWGVAKDMTEAAKWTRKAAEQGHSGAQYNWGLFYANGWGVVQNRAEAVKWFRKAAKQNFKPAQDVLKKAGLTW
ncbi:MAG: sel1 repeat family protein [Lentisphaeria bacterium]|nr:sel1 repeat family protein [Lentisphaeria bacterium]